MFCVCVREEFPVVYVHRITIYVELMAYQFAVHCAIRVRFFGVCSVQGFNKGFTEFVSDILPLEIKEFKIGNYISH